MKIPVLMYHDIRPDNYSLSLSLPEERPYIQRETQFAEQIIYLQSQDFQSMVVSELVALSIDNSCKNVVITFDDGALSNFYYAFPILLNASLRATFFITTDFVGKKGFMQWEHLKEMQKEGMEIGSHTVTHPIPSQLGPEQFFF